MGRKINRRMVISSGNAADIKTPMYTNLRQSDSGMRLQVLIVGQIVSGALCASTIIGCIGRQHGRRPDGNIKNPAHIIEAGRGDALFLGR